MWEEKDDLQEHVLSDVDEELLDTWIERNLVDVDTEHIICEAIALKKQSDEIMKEVYVKESDIYEIENTQNVFETTLMPSVAKTKKLSRYWRR